MDYRFFIQYYSQGSSSRGIQSGGRILTAEDLLDREQFKKFVGGHKVTLLYADGNAFLENVKSMRLDEFQSVFGKVSYGEIAHLVGDAKNGGYFRKEITNHYAPKPKYVPGTTQYGIGASVIPKNKEERCVYLGNFEKFEAYGNNSLIYTLSGHLYVTKSEVKSPLDLARAVIYSPRAFRRNFMKVKKSVVSDAIAQENDPLNGETEGTLSFVLPTFVYPNHNGTVNVNIQFKRADK